VARILVAEDSLPVAEFVARALRHDGHEVVSVEDGLAALAALDCAQFDLLLTDIVMPGLDGIALALRVTRDNPKLRIVLMTGFAEERQRAHNLDALIHRVIEKPFTLQQICTIVAEELAVSQGG
jgi:two-component system cell cycle response regulator CpdR